ncbi:MAG: M28 family peptidase [Acidobacteriia bacterium]|nr:M28 family peptidase [Terriglobia bacterium]
MNRLVISAKPKRLFSVIATILALTLAATSAPSTVSTADSQRYLNDIKTLTTPSMEGRGDGTRGLTRAAHLIEKRFANLGLKPAGTHSYLQSFTVITGAKLKSNNHFTVHHADSKTDLKVNQDFVPFSFSPSGVADAPVVFAGYGASADEFQYDDYAGLDVKDKIVVVLRYEPAGFAAKSGNQGLTQHSQLITKAINARNHGAKAIVLVNGKLGDGEEDLLTRFGSVSGPENVGILFLQVKNVVADSWFQAAGKSLADIQNQINTSSKPGSFAFPENLRVSLNVSIENTRATVNNVLAYLPGKTDEYVIIGAHYDHLGRGNFDSLAPSQIGQIHPGADDNASGTAGVLEIAHLLAPMQGQLQRGVLFASFAGEELGLLGSAAWVKQPTLPLDKAVAMLNMDMIGRIKDDKVYIGGVGTGSTFKSLLESEQAKSALKLELSAGGYAASDHTSFVAKKIPVLFFFSGLHSDYHKPSDTWDKINAPEAARLLDFISSVGTQIADAPERPTFINVVEDRPAGGAGAGRGYGPYFGSIPDFGQTENGVKFSDVRPGSPAAKAGLKAGDVLVQFGDKPIKNLYDFTDALRRSKVGDVVEVKVLRDGQPITASVKLEQRK